MYNHATRLYPCSMCGKDDSATEEMPFCGKCNEEYCKMREAERVERRRTTKPCPGECDTSYHCGSCGVCLYDGQRNRCEPCSL